MAEQFRLRWPVEKHVVNQYFGENPDFYKPFGLPGHEGLDLYAPLNANVYAAADGEVYRVDHPANHPYGLQIRIKHEMGTKTYRTIYAHLKKTFVTEGQRVQVGQRIALADNTGNSFGSHLHLTLKVDGAQTPGYPAGIVDPWPYFEALTAPPSDALVVYPTDLLSLRAAPTTDSERLTVLDINQPLIVLDEAEVARTRIGQEGQWIHVRTEGGLSGYVAAWFVHLTGEAPPATSLIVYPTDFLSVRARPTTDSNRLSIVAPEDPLTVLGDAERARAKVGREGEWLNVEAPSGHVGYVAAWFVHLADDLAFSFATPSPPLTVYPIVDLNLRAQPTIYSPRVGGATFDEPLSVIADDLTTARAKIGQAKQWLYVETEDGERGWAAAWLLAQ